MVAGPGTHGGEHWSTHQLTEFLALVLSYSDVDTAYQGGIERIAEALEAEVGAILAGDEILAVVGFPAAAVPADDLRRIARTRPAETELSGLGHCVTETAMLDDDSATVLVVARMDGVAFTRPEASLLRGMARTLTLCVRMLRTLTAERSLRETSDVLVAVERAIAQRAPLQEVLDAIAQGAQRLLRVDIALLRLQHPADPSRMLLVSSQGLDEGSAVGLRQASASDGLVACAVAEDRLVSTAEEAARAAPGAGHDLGAMMAAPVREGSAVIGAMVVATRDRTRRYQPAERDLLLRFAEHASLALTDARTLEQLTQAMYDPLTGLANRGLFLDRLQVALSRADDAGTRVALLFCDLDGFKGINDNLGHTTGDALLVAVAERIRAAIRDGDLAARLGGDEFAILLEHVIDRTDATAVARHILEALSGPLWVDGCQVRVGISIGVVLRDPGREGADELLRNADLAMYRSKADGTERLTVYESWMHQQLVDRLRLDDDVRQAVDSAQLEVHYQPVVELASGRPIGVEALARWRHPTRGMVPPAVFIPLAEDNGVIHRLGLTILRAACADVQRWRERFPQHRRLRLTVNVSALQLHDEAFVSRVLETLGDSGLPPSGLVLEITETALVRDPQSVAERLRALKAAGVSVAVDDFGTGYSSLDYLRRFPADILKIDKVFIDDIGRAGADGALADGIIRLADALGVQTVAEGVEHRAQVTRLIQIGCRYGQGYAFGAPLPARALGAYLGATAGRDDPVVMASGLR